MVTLPHLTSLEIQGNSITDFSAFSYFHKLPNPRLVIRQPADLERLATLTDLTTLELFIDYAINDEPWLNLQPLRRLRQLTWLQLYGYGLKDLSALHRLTELTYLEIHSAYLTDLRPLRSLTNLIELKIPRLWNAQSAC